jgi:hypothetical protein
MNSLLIAYNSIKVINMSVTSVQAVVQKKIMVFLI